LTGKVRIRPQGLAFTALNAKGVPEPSCGHIHPFDNHADW